MNPVHSHCIELGLMIDGIKYCIEIEDIMEAINKLEFYYNKMQKMAKQNKFHETEEKLLNIQLDLNEKMRIKYRREMAYNVKTGEITFYGRGGKPLSIITDWRNLLKTASSSFIIPNKIVKLSYKKKCAWCKRFTYDSKKKKCSHCKLSFYCCRDHQKRHWKAIHRMQCWNNNN